MMAIHIMICWMSGIHALDAKLSELEWVHAQMHAMQCGACREHISRLFWTQVRVIAQVRAAPFRLPCGAAAWTGSRPRPGSVPWFSGTVAAGEELVLVSQAASIC